MIPQVGRESPGECVYGAVGGVSADIAGIRSGHPRAIGACQRLNHRALHTRLHESVEGRVQRKPPKGLDSTPPALVAPCTPLHTHVLDGGRWLASSPVGRSARKSHWLDASSTKGDTCYVMFYETR